MVTVTSTVINLKVCINQILFSQSLKLLPFAQVIFQMTDKLIINDIYDVIFLPQDTEHGTNSCAAHKSYFNSLEMHPNFFFSRNSTILT